MAAGLSHGVLRGLPQGLLLGLFLALSLALVLPGPLSARQVPDTAGARLSREQAGLSAEASARPYAPTSTPGAQDRRRPFRHAVHDGLSCRSCHTAGGRHGVPRAWTPEDCASCHHDAARQLDCVACHDAEALGGPRPATETMALSVWEEPRTRELPFDHERHALACTECHQTPVSLAPRECGSCHERHTTAGVACAACHRPPPPQVHDVDAHLTCTGGRCHTGAATARPMLARASCLVCHQDKEEHRPGKECVGCHFIPATATPAAIWHARPLEPLPPPPR